MMYNDMIAHTVGGTIGIGFVEILLTEGDAANTLVIDMFPEFYDFAYRFVGFNFVAPGLNRQGSFVIENDTGQSYIVTDYSFFVDSIGIQRVYNEMAQSSGLSLAQVAALPANEWYQLNVDYYGEENLNNLATLSRMFGHGLTGPGSAAGYGVSVGVEDSPEMIALAQFYIYNQIQLSFDTDEFPINGQGLSGEALTLWDYVTKTAANQHIVLNQVFSEIVGPDGFSSTIAYTQDYDGIGNEANGAYVDFAFTLTLTRIVTVTYNGNENSSGTTPVDENSYLVGSSATVLGNIGSLTKTGYTFAGWNTAPDGTGASYAAGDSIALQDDVILYALWVEQAIPPPTEVCRPCCYLHYYGPCRHTGCCSPCVCPPKLCKIRSVLWYACTGQ